MFVDYTRTLYRLLGRVKRSRDTFVPIRRHSGERTRAARVLVVTLYIPYMLDQFPSCSERITSETRVYAYVYAWLPDAKRPYSAPGEALTLASRHIATTSQNVIDEANSLRETSPYFAL